MKMEEVSNLKIDDAVYTVCYSIIQLPKDKSVGVLSYKVTEYYIANLWEVDRRAILDGEFEPLDLGLSGSARVFALSNKETGKALVADAYEMFANYWLSKEEASKSLVFRLQNLFSKGRKP